MLLFIAVSLGWGCPVPHRHARDVARDGAARHPRHARACCGRRRASSSSTTSSGAAPAQRRAAQRNGALARSAGGPGGRRRASCSCWGPHYGILINALIYLPLIVVAVESAVRPRCRCRAGRAPCAASPTSSPRARGRAATASSSSMIVLAGGASLFVGNAYQAQMPEFAQDLGPRRSAASPTACCSAPMPRARYRRRWSSRAAACCRREAAHRIRPRDVLVRCDRRLRAGDAAIRSRCACSSPPASSSSVQLDGADPGAGQRAGATCAAA